MQVASSRMTLDSVNLMKGPSIDQDAVVHMSSTFMPLNKAVDTAIPRVRVCMDPSGEGSPCLSIGMCNALAEPSCQAFLGQSLTGHTVSPT